MAQQQQRPQPNPQQPLDQLQGTMNLLLQILGGVISDPGKRKDPSIRVHIGRIIPEANGRFHDALDRLEDDLFRAKAVMRRELMVLRATRARKEAEANAKNAITPTQQPNTVAEELKQEMVHLTTPVADKAQQEPPKDVQPNGIKGSNLAAPIVEPTTTDPAPTEATAPTASANLDESPPDFPSATDEINDDPDFDAMFDEFARATPTNNDTVNSIDMSDFPDTNADVSSLLPGLENYASMPDTTLPENTTDNTAATIDATPDFGMLGIPEQNNDQDQKQQDAPLDEEMDEYANDNTFDELFDLGSTGNAGDAAELDDWMTW